jgi:hypothetical protein
MNDGYADRPNKQEEITHLEIASNALFSDHRGPKRDPDLAVADKAIKKAIAKRKKAFTKRTGLEWGFGGPARRQREGVGASA